MTTPHPEVPSQASDRFDVRRRWPAVVAAAVGGGVLGLALAVIYDDLPAAVPASSVAVTPVALQAPPASPPRNTAPLAASAGISVTAVNRPAASPVAARPAATALTPGTGKRARDSAPVLVPPRTIRLPQFGNEAASDEARHTAQWALYSGDNEGRAVVIIDKRQARIYIFSPEGELLRASPVLLGSAVGDHTVPGVGDKPVAQVLPEERTTPAGRFIAEMGKSSVGEDVVWVDYDAAVSMHRVRPWVKSERRLERLASRTPLDNRISYGCINLPRQVYEDVLAPTVRRDGAVIYVLPELSQPQQVFGSYDVPNADVLALFANKSR